MAWLLRGHGRDTHHGSGTLSECNPMDKRMLSRKNWSLTTIDYSSVIAAFVKTIGVICCILKFIIMMLYALGQKSPAHKVRGESCLRSLMFTWLRESCPIQKPHVARKDDLWVCITSTPGTPIMIYVHVVKQPVHVIPKKVVHFK